MPAARTLAALTLLTASLLLSACEGMDLPETVEESQEEIAEELE